MSTTPLIYRTDATEWHEISANDDECMNALEHVFSRPLVDLKDPANLFANAYGMDEPDEEFVCTFLVSLFSVCVCLEGGGVQFVCSKSHRRCTALGPSATARAVFNESVYFDFISFTDVILYLIAPNQKQPFFLTSSL